MVAVVVGTVRLLAVGAVLASLNFDKIRVILLLLPAVRIWTLVLIWATFPIGANEVVHLPVRAHFARVHEHGGSASVVLPVVGINTNLTVVVVLAIRTPD